MGVGGGGVSLDSRGQRLQLQAWRSHSCCPHPPPPVPCSLCQHLPSLHGSGSGLGPCSSLRQGAQRICYLWPPAWPLSSGSSSALAFGGQRWGCCQSCYMARLELDSAYAVCSLPEWSRSQSWNGMISSGRGSSVWGGGRCQGEVGVRGHKHGGQVGGGQVAGELKWGGHRHHSGGRGASGRGRQKRVQTPWRACCRGRGAGHDGAGVRPLDSSLPACLSPTFAPPLLLFAPLQWWGQGQM